MNKQTEYKLAVSISQYLSLQHKDIIFKFTNDDGNLTMQQAIRAKKLNPKRGYPDLFIAEPSRDFSGIYLELKKSYDEIYKKNGELRQNKHLIEQVEMHEGLRKKGYFVTFCWSLQGFIGILEDYLEN